MREQLRRRITETYKETKSIIKIENKKSEEFWTKSGARQGCPMSLTPFNIYLMDLEIEVRKEQTGGDIIVGKEIIWR